MNDICWWTILVYLNPQMPAIHYDVIKLSTIWHTSMNRAIALHRDAQKRARREEPSLRCGASQKPWDEISTQFVERNYPLFPFHSHSPISVSWYWANMQTPQCILWSLSITLRWWYTLPSSQLTFWGCWNANMTSRLPKGALDGFGSKSWRRVISRDFLWFFGIKLLFKA